MKINGCKLYPGAVSKFNSLVEEALRKTGDAVHDDLLQSNTMPFETGNLQNLSTFVDESKLGKGIVSIVSDTPYARRLYFHPEYNFQRVHNSNAGGEWFEPYLTGAKKDYAQKVFSAFIRKGTI